MIDLKSPDYYLNRELTWINFNRRVLSCAQNPKTPLLERVKFLAIVGSNFDEFFMKRIGGLKQQVGAHVHDLTIDGHTPQEQITKCINEVLSIQAEMRGVYLDLLKDLKANDIVISKFEDLPKEKQSQLRKLYKETIYPLLTPLSRDPAHPFPFISNLSLNLFVELAEPDGDRIVLTRVKVPVGSGIPRFLQVPGENTFCTINDVIASNLDILFPGMDILSCDLFRIIRNANTERDEEEADDLMSMIELELRDRKFAPIVRLEIRDTVAPRIKGMLAAELGLDEEQDVYEADEMIGTRDLMEIANLDIPELRDPDHHPITNIQLQDDRNIFHIIREHGSILLQHPYESFATSVERFVREASRDPKVRAIKLTLYRTSSGSRIIQYLLDAARNGKQVAVVVELKARFDEAANIGWANRLEEAGIHVTYGVVGLKTHSKVILVVREDFSGLQHYAHIGTGNYHAGTARLYSDLGLLTSDSDIGSDLTELFNFLTTGFKPSRKYSRLLTTPKVLKKELLRLIGREIEHVADGKKGVIRFKCNALEDPQITEALYIASMAGVKVELNIRDTCRLRPGLKHVSENINVFGVVGRFLEHTRVYTFLNGGDEDIFIGSADLMRRNLDSRVEVVVPILDPKHRKVITQMLDVQAKDKHNVWDMQSDGSYLARTPSDDDNSLGCQDALIKLADKRHTSANKLKKRRKVHVGRSSPDQADTLPLSSRDDT